MTRRWACSALLVAMTMWLAGGVYGLIYLVWAWGVGRLVIFLWTQQSRFDKTLAAVLMPAVLLTYLLPGHLKRAIRGLDKTEARR
jgi:hypothetical protein